jgi:hypothetical protein
MREARAVMWVPKRLGNEPYRILTYRPGIQHGFLADFSTISTGVGLPKVFKK